MSVTWGQGQAALTTYGRTKQLTKVYRITRTDNVVRLLTIHDRQLKTATALHDPEPGTDGFAWRLPAGLDHGTTEIAGHCDDAVIAFDDLRAGRYRDAKVEEQIIDWKVPWVDPVREMTWYVLDANYDVLRWSFELGSQLSLIDAKIAGVYSRNCNNDLGDGFGAGTGFCGFDLTSYPETVTALVATGITPTRRTFRLQTGASNEFTSATHIADYFAFGRVEFNTGNNIGLKQLVQSNTLTQGPAGSRYIDVTLSNGMPLDVTLGDSVDIVVGCDKLPNTCRNKFSRFVDFRGDPFIPGSDRMLRSGDAT